MDLAFALGFPHLRFLAPPHGRGAALQVAPLTACDPIAWPSDVACAAIHAWGAPDFSLSLRGRETQLALRSTDRVTPEEAARLIERRVHGVYSPIGFDVVLYLLEAFVGPELVARSLVDSLSRVAPEAWFGYTPAHDDGAFALGFLLLRVGADVHEALRAQLDALFRHITAKRSLGRRGSTEGEASIRNLDLALHGVEGVARSARGRAGHYARWQLVHVYDDPSFVSSVLSKWKDPGDCEPDPRLAFLGGETVMKLESKWWPKYGRPGRPGEGAAAGQLAWVEAFWEVRHLIVVKVMLSIAHESRARKRARAWFSAHARYALDVLPGLARSSGDVGRWAKAVCASLDS